MFGFSQGLGFDEAHDKTLATCLDLQSVALEIGVDVPFAFGLSQDMSTEQLQTVQSMLEQALAKSDEEMQERLRQLGRCPMGFKWNREGHGWRCEGGTHFVDAKEIEKYMQ